MLGCFAGSRAWARLYRPVVPAAGRHSVESIHAWRGSTVSAASPAPGPAAPGFRRPAAGELSHARRQQHDHGRAIVEARHLGEALQHDALATVILAGDAVTVGRDLLAAPHRFHAGHQQRTDHHADHRAEAGVEVADQALVAGKQARHAVHRGRADAEQAARHVHGLAQGAGPRHVHAVVVARRQVHGGVQAIVVRLGVLVAAQQLGGGERLPLGLEDAAGLDLPQLADAAVGRHHQAARIGVGHARARLQRTGEELVEGGVAARVRVGRFVQVDVELAGDRVDQPARYARIVRVRQRTRHRRQQAVGQGVRQGGGEAHGAVFSVSFCRSRAMAGALNGAHQAGKAALRIEHGQAGRMLDGVVLGVFVEVLARHLLEHEAQRGGEAFQRGHIGGGGQGVLVEAVHVLAQPRGAVAVGVDRDEQHPRAQRVRQRFPLVLRAGQFGQGGRAHVRAEGEAQEHQGPVALQFARDQAGAVGLGQIEVGQFTRLRVQRDRFGGRGVGRRLRRKHLLGGQQARPAARAISRMMPALRLNMGAPREVGSIIPAAARSFPPQRMPPRAPAPIIGATLPAVPP